MPKENKSSLETSFNKGDQLEGAVVSLSNKLDVMQNNFEKILQKLTILTENIDNTKMVKNNTSGASVEDDSCGNEDKNEIEGSNHVERKRVGKDEVKGYDRSYITAWKDMGGKSLYFEPKGTMHPKDFINKLSNTLKDAGVPLDKQVDLAVGCLRGSASDWAITKRSSFTDIEIFNELFIHRYWGVDQERSLFCEIKYGKFKGGFRADYFLGMAKEAAYLNETLNEEVLLLYLTQHFSLKIQRGILNAGLKNIEGIEKHLRPIDATYENNGRQNTNSDEDNLNRNVQNSQNNRVNYNNRNDEHDGDGHRNNNDHNNRARVNNNNWRRNNREANVIKTYDELLTDSELESEEKRHPCSDCPVLTIEIEEIPVVALVDSGSQITVISEKLFEKVSRGKKNIAILPVTGITIKGAVGTKEQRVKQQVFMKLIIGKEEMESVFLIVSNLSKSVIIGSDWLKKHDATIVFQNKLLKFKNQGEWVKVDFGEDSQPKLMISKVEVDKDDERDVDDKELCVKLGNSCRFDEEHRQKFKELVNSYKEVFSNKPGLTNIYTHVIKMRDKTPFFRKSYPIPFAFRQEVQNQIDEILKMGITCAD